MDRRVLLWSTTICVASIVCGFWLWLSPNEKTDDQLAVEYYRALDLSIEALEVLLGEDLVPSDTLYVSGINGMRPDDTRESRFEKLLKGVDHAGLNPMNIIFYDTSYPTNYWKVAVPGCAPRTCVGLINEVEFHLTQKSEADKYSPGMHSSKWRKIVFEPELIGSTVYYAKVNVHFDFANRVTTVDLSAVRGIQGELEKLSTHLSNGAPTDVRRIFYSRRILADAGNALSEDG